MKSTPARERSDLTQQRYDRILRRYFDAKKGRLRKYDALGASARNILACALRSVGESELANTITYPKRHRVDLEFPPEDVIKQLEKAFEKLDPASCAVAQFTLRTGLRSFEVLMLPRKRVEAALATGTLRVTRKGNYEANVAVGKSAAANLKALLKIPRRTRKARGHTPVEVLPWETVGQVLSYSSSFGAAYQVFWSRVKKASKGLETPVSPHWLRHAFATRMVRSEAPLAIVQKQLGHADIKTTMRYAHASTEDVKRYL